jgi:hypothetical protein
MDPHFEYNSPGDTGTHMSSLSMVVNKAVRDGYTDTMKVTKQGLFDTTRNKTYGPRDVRIVDFFRFEGESDPADNTIMYKIETVDGAKGTLIDAYGPYADETVNRFVAEVEEVGARITKHKSHRDKNRK